MPTNPRDEDILALMRPAGAGRVATLARRLGVSQETIRRAFVRLESAGMVLRHHGGATLREAGAEPSFSHRMRLQPEAKRAIARAVLPLVPDGAAVFLDVGSTTAHAALALQARRDLLVVTNALAVAHALTGRNGNRVIMAGGELRAHDGGAFGAEVLAYLQQFRVGRALLSAAGITSEGVFLQDLREAEIARAMAAQAGEVILLADATKHTRPAPIRACGWEKVACLVSDAPPPPQIAAALAAAGTAFVRA
jgi:DeoR family glycerol-3-phosphate regulon repressor